MLGRMSTEPTQKQPNFSFELYRLLLIRGIARALAPIAVLTSIVHWWLISWVHGLVFAALTINYVLVYALMWISPPLTNGPWRVRAWQTFVLLINVFALPIVWYRHRGTVPWIFIAVNILFFVGLFAATKIMFYFQERLPMGQIFAARKGDATMPPPPASPPPGA